MLCKKITTEFLKEKRIDTVIIVHNGALGDFISCWAAIFSVSIFFKQQSNNNNLNFKLYFWGKESYFIWLESLGFKKAPFTLSAKLESLYFCTKFPEELKNSLIFWFCLDKLICYKKNFINLIQVPILLNFNFSSLLHLKQGKREKYTKQLLTDKHILVNSAYYLNNCQIKFIEEYKTHWAYLHGKWQGQDSKEIALFIGSGHVAKQWSLANFKILAEDLLSLDYLPLFIVGEVELERGFSSLDLPDIKVESPFPAIMLGERLKTVRAVVTVDAGPAHLAAIYGVPGVVLFGPSSDKIWAADGLKVLRCTEKLSCVPCTVTIKDITCTNPVCMKYLAPQRVLQALLAEIEN